MPGPQVPSPSAEISRGAVQLLREYTGRGPTKARTTIADDLIVIVLGDSLSKGERHLAAMGKEEQVLGTRHAYQQVMRPALIGLVEEHSARTVVAMLSDNHLDPDVAVEVFVLDPLEANGDDGWDETDAQ